MECGFCICASHLLNSNHVKVIRECDAVVARMVTSWSQLHEIVRRAELYRAARGEDSVRVSVWVEKHAQQDYFVKFDSL